MKVQHKRLYTVVLNALLVGLLFLAGVFLRVVPGHEVPCSVGGKEETCAMGNTDRTGSIIRVPDGSTYMIFPPVSTRDHGAVIWLEGWVYVQALGWFWSERAALDFPEHFQPMYTSFHPDWSTNPEFRDMSKGVFEVRFSTLSRRTVEVRVPGLLSRVTEDRISHGKDGG